MAKRKREYGNGDPCPLFDHGQMFVVQGAAGAYQYCAHEEHIAHGKRSSTRCIWPLDDTAFRMQVAAATLPELEKPNGD